MVYARYDEHQRDMERYWCLRWLMQENIAQCGAVVLREATVRLENLPLVVRVPSLPELPPGARVSVGVDSIDLLDKTLDCTWRATLDGPDSGQAVEDAREAL